MPAAQDYRIQIIKRFSGGGTVVTDENTIFATVILQTETLPPGIECYPRPLMRWSESLYAPVFSPYGDFNLQENGKNTCTCASLALLYFLPTSIFIALCLFVVTLIKHCCYIDSCTALVSG